jgi:hypothetical protein
MIVENVLAGDLVADVTKMLQVALIGSFGSWLKTGGNMYM